MGGDQNGRAQNRLAFAIPCLETCCLQGQMRQITPAQLYKVTTQGDQNGRAQNRLAFAIPCLETCYLQGQMRQIAPAPLYKVTTHLLQRSASKKGKGKKDKRRENTLR